MSKWLGAAALAFTAAVARAETAPPPLDAYGKLPSIETIKISPDGKRIAFIVTDGEARTVAVSDLDTQRPIVRGPVGTKKTTAVMWAGSNHVIVVTEQDTFVPGVLGGRKSWLTASDVDVDKRRVDPLISLDPTARGADTLHMNVIAGEPQVREVKGRTVIFTPGYSFPPGGGKAHVALFSHDAASGRSELFNDGAEHTRRWLVGSDGQALAEERVDQDKRLWSLRVRRPGGVFSEVMSATAEYEHPAIVGLGRDARSVLLLTYEKGDGAGLESHLVEFSPGQTSPSAPIFDGAPDRLVFDPVTDALIGVGKLAGDDRRYTFFDPKDQAHWEGAEKAYPGCLVTPVSMSADHKRWIVIVDSPTEGPAYALINFDTRRGSWLGENYKAASAFLSEKRPIAFRAADGLPLSGYLTLPRDRLAKGLPLVVLPHGGPAERDGPGFDWWAQALASRGYAVLQVNFRGSSGLGGAFETAGFGQ